VNTLRVFTWVKGKTPGKYPVRYLPGIYHSRYLPGIYLKNLTES